MPIVDHATRMITCKLVYYGPGRAGKTANLSYLHAALPDNQVGELRSVSTRRNCTLSFDYNPAELATVGAYRVQFQICTAPGQSQNRGVRQLLLRGVDGIAFIADSRRSSLDENLESLQDLHINLAEQSVAARSLPFVFQYNKQDLPSAEILSPKELSEALNFRRAPELSASASNGTGVFETLRALGAEVLHRLGVRDVAQRELVEASA